MPRIIISGGGTGGHVFPAIAIAHALRKILPTVDILFVGAQGRIEMEKVPQAGYPIEGLWISGFQRRLTLQNALFPLKLASSLWKSHCILQKFKPDVAVGVGGYASGALLQMATLWGIPALIQEQNSYPGITNKLLAKRVQKICVAYPGLERFFPPEKILLTGNPVRAGIGHCSVPRADLLAHFGLLPGRKTLFVTGGSLGARGINAGVLHLLDNCKAQNWQILWQTGKLYFEEMKKAAEPYGSHVQVLSFVDKMDWAYTVADAVLSRAGAGAISELCLVGKPLVLMPSPNVAEDHQTANASSLVASNAALMVRDADASTQLPAAINTLLFDDTKRQLLSQNLLKHGIPDAADRIAREVLALVK